MDAILVVRGCAIKLVLADQRCREPGPLRAKYFDCGLWIAVGLYGSEAGVLRKSRLARAARRDAK